MKLDLRDRKILYELDVNARQSDAQIGRKLKISKEVVAYRINRLIKERIVRNFTAIINTHAFGYQGFRIFFKFKDISKEREKEFIDFVKSKFIWIVRVRGNWSYNSLIYTNNMIKLEKFLNQIKEKFEDNFLKMQISPVTQIYHYRREFLLDNKKIRTSYEILEKIKEFQLDEKDFKILEAIANNGRATTVELAEEINLTERIVRYRLKNLVKNKIILGFRSHLDLEKLGYRYYKIHLFLNKHSKQTIEKLTNFTHTHPNTIYLTKTIGGWDFELEVCFKGSKELYNFLDKLTNKFSGIIRDYEFLEYDKEFQIKYFQVLD
ncbi:MAG: Lrp/AsnC family transcriptional regulator [Candidatus Pacearchaeota archaeon]